MKKKSFEETLWKSANKLRGSVEPAEYKHVVLSLIFLKFAGEKFENRKRELIQDGKENYVDIVDFYNMKNIFYLNKNARWEYLKENSKQNDIAIKIDNALTLIEKDNKSLRGALPDNYFSRLDLETNKLAALIDTINNIDTNDKNDEDIVGRVYEYFLSKFAIAEGKAKGEFYTPKNIVNLIVELIEPMNGKIYDPCCGSGGMFVQSHKFVENHKGDKKNISVYGQENISTTFKLAKMNLSIRGIYANLGDIATNTFSNDLHKELKADYIMANPPFNQRDWREKNELINDERWNGYETPSEGNANYGWILHIVSKLAKNGVACFVMSNGALAGEDKIRKRLIQNDLIEAIFVLPMKMFYTTDISVSLWIINKNKSTNKKNDRNRENEILFCDLRQWGEPFEKKFIKLSDEELKKIIETYKNWKSEKNFKKYKNIDEFCYSASIKEIEKKDFSLAPSKYINLKKKDNDTNFEKEILNIKNQINKISKENNIIDEEFLSKINKIK